MPLLPSIPEFYRNKNIFITGGTGFIGKVLVEKLLRSCPDLRNIYLLIREKKGQSPAERIKAVTDLPLFDLIRSQNPDSLAKVKFVKGDVRELDLGLHPDDRKFLIEEINVIFHGAASVRFDDSLTDAVLMNTRGTRELVNLAKDVQSLDVLVHISTTFCNTHHKVVEEKLYPAYTDWRKIVEIAEKTDRHVLTVLTEKVIHPLTNTYTFTKFLAEHVIHDLCEGKVPAIVYRPSIVIPTAVEPMPAWVDNLNGPVGLLTARNKGLIRVGYGNIDIVPDYVPADVTVKAIIISSWKQATYKEENKNFTTSFYNGSNYNLNPVSVGELQRMGLKVHADVPFENVLWHPDGSGTRCYYNYYMQLVLYHLLPALCIDGLLKIFGKKPRLTKILRRIYNATSTLEYFMVNQWDFVNEKTMNLRHELLPSDVDSFSFNIEDIDRLEFLKMSAVGVRKYILKEGDDFTAARRHAKRMWVLSQISNGLKYLILFWLVFVKFDLFGMLTHKCEKLLLHMTTR